MGQRMTLTEGAVLCDHRLSQLRVALPKWSKKVGKLTAPVYNEWGGVDQTPPQLPDNQPDLTDASPFASWKYQG